MPWKVAKSDQCPASHPWAVIRSDTGEKKACHATKQGAQKQLALLYMKQKNGEIAMDAEIWEALMTEVLDYHPAPNANTQNPST